MFERLQMYQEHWQEMRAHVDACSPLEGCGLLAGAGTLVDRVIPIANAAGSPTRFRMDPEEQLRAFQEIENAGRELLGVFHSHPPDARDRSLRPRGPSETDVRESAYPVVHVIWSQHSGAWQAHGYWIEHGSIRDVPLFIHSTE